MRDKILKYQVSFVLFFLIVLLSCDSEENTSLTLNSTTWVFEYYIDEESSELVKYTNEQKMLISFEADSILLISGFCNQGSGNYETEGNTISFENLILTEKACIPIQMNTFELELMQKLHYTNKFNISQNELLFYYQDALLMGFSIKNSI